MRLALLITGAVLLILGLFVSTCVWLASGPEAGVKLSNQMDQYALDYLAKHKVLEPGEQVVCYYDETVSMDGTEAALVTTSRLVYYKASGAAPRVTSIRLQDITDVKHHSEGLTGDVFDVTSRTGLPMRIEVAPLNGGDLFGQQLDAAWKRATAAAPAR